MKILGRGKVVVFLLVMTTTVTGFLFSQSDEGKVDADKVMNLTVEQAVDYANQNSKTLKFLQGFNLIILLVLQKCNKNMQLLHIFKK